MQGAIQLVTAQGGTVAGLVAIAIEENETTKAFRQDYHCVSAVVPGTFCQAECNGQTLSSFADYKPEMAFPACR